MADKNKASADSHSKDDKGHAGAPRDDKATKADAHEDDKAAKADGPGHDKGHADVSKDDKADAPGHDKGHADVSKDDKAAKADVPKDDKTARADAPEAKQPPAPEPAPAPAPAPAGDSGEPEFAEMPRHNQIDTARAPESPASPPGIAPPGDSRSLRRGNDFVLIYRDASYLITRAGTVGTEGRWEVVEYPSQGAAAHAYAMKCSELSGEGFRDLR